ncbi:AAA family ATPase [Acetivibrio straminisolvens]|jgi:SpoVK/Ycf46/Vps4 family AAA+-type ATPase|uniref:Cell division protein FtsH n=1 Tax=Acetivibrio straminisolvens JCM 21531 TaxID=1294263 RepID=W4V5W1_9FIRM|nr:ATP-binding protein [Acetivibrio straminisolvens]GAE88557.1 cell division protein FtsH [Acetivibrio straminisolvens JCM 21531]
MWFDKFLSIYKAGISHEFILYFNIRDMVDNYRYIDRYIYEEFIKQRGFSIVAFYDISRGLSFLEPGMEREFNKITSNEAIGLKRVLPSKIFPYIDVALKNTKMVLFIEHAEKIIPAGDTGSMSLEERMALIWLCEWSNDPKISTVGSTIIMTANNLAEVSSEILNSSYRVEPILVELPDEEERRKYIEYLLKDENIKMDISVDEFAKLSSGLSKKAIKDIKLKAEAEDVPVSFEFIKDKKHSVLKKEYGDVLEFIYPEISFEDIGGMERAKSYLLKNIVEPIKKGDLRRVPMGILLCGPSGTGKTLLVNALAKSSGFNCVKIDMSRILGQYVGESEKNFKKCLLGAQSQQPVIVFVDEIDTAFRRGESGDNGVSRNIFSEFLQFTSNTNNRGKVIFIAATNRPDLLDAALKRAGRFDKKIPILLPEEDERADIFRIMIKKYGFETDIEDFTPFAAQTENYTGAEIETVVRKAYEIANEDNIEGCILTAEILNEAISRCRPSTQQVEFMTMLAIKECDDKDLLPERYRHYLDERSKFDGDL